MRLQLASVLHRALNNAVASFPPCNLCQTHLDSKRCALSSVWHCKRAGYGPPSTVAPGRRQLSCLALARQVRAECAQRICSPLDSGKGRTCFCWCVQGLTCANPEALIKHGHHCGSVPWGEEGPAEISAFSAAVKSPI